MKRSITAPSVESLGLKFHVESLAGSRVSVIRSGRGGLVLLANGFLSNFKAEDGVFIGALALSPGCGHTRFIVSQCAPGVVGFEANYYTFNLDLEPFGMRGISYGEYRAPEIDAQIKRALSFNRVLSIELETF